ncbi:MAG: alpha/beta hydrolase [Acidimicrobiales bacterium]
MGGPDAADLSEMSVEEARAVIVMLAAADGEPEPVEAVEDRTIPGPAGDIPVRLYRPAQPTGAILIWYHGGGWVIGDLETADPTARKLANRTGALVVSVDYRLAPEHPYPAAVDDAWAALQWVAERGADLGGDPSRLAVGGDSAGGNLAAIVSVRARDAGLEGLRHQLLVYPAVDLTLSHPSIDENGEGYLLTKTGMVWFAEHYLGPATGRGDLDKHPDVSPLYTADLAGVAPATVITAGFDPLRDEGQAYAAALTEAGVAVEEHRYPTMIHGFISMAGVTTVTNEALDAAGAALRASLG